MAYGYAVIATTDGGDRVVAVRATHEDAVAEWQRRMYAALDAGWPVILDPGRQEWQLNQVVWSYSAGASDWTVSPDEGANPSCAENGHTHAYERTTLGLEAAPMCPDMDQQVVATLHCAECGAVGRRFLPREVFVGVEWDR